MSAIYSNNKSMDSSIIGLVYALAMALFFIFLFIFLSFIGSEHNEEKRHDKIKQYHMKSIQLALASVDVIYEAHNRLEKFKNQLTVIPHLTLHPRNIANGVAAVLNTNAKILSKAQIQFNDPEFTVIINNINANTGSLTKNLIKNPSDYPVKNSNETIYNQYKININEILSPLTANYRQLTKMHEIRLKEKNTNTNSFESGNGLIIAMLVLLLFIAGFAILFIVTKKIRASLEKQSQLFNALRSSDEQVSLLMKFTSEAIYGIDINGHCTFANNACAQILGYEDPDELLGKNMHELLHHSHSDDTNYPVEKCKLYQAHKDGTATHVDDEVFWKKDGQHFYAEYWSNPIIKNHKIIGSVINFFDISKKRKAADELLRKQDTLDKAQEIAHIGSWDWDIQTNELRWSDEIYRIFGLEPQSFNATYDEFLKTIPPDDRQSVIGAVESSIENIDTPYNIEHRVVRPNGEVRTVHEEGVIYRDENLDPYRMIGTVLDVTERRRTAIALSNEQAQLQAIINSIPDAIIFVNPQRKIVATNPSVEKILGYKQQELIGETTQILYEENDDYQDLGKTRYNKQASHSSDPYIIKYKHKNGSVFSGETMGTKVIDSTGETLGFIGLIRDVSERIASENELKVYRENLETLVNERTRKLEETRDELVRNERLATLGKLTATVSHELRNPLGAMRPSLHIIKSKKNKVSDEHVQQAIARVDRNITRCDHIIDELLDFTRSSEPIIQHVVLDEWIELLLDEQIIPDKIILKRELNTGQSRIAFDPDRMRRAVINILENAFHATSAECEAKARKQMAVTLSTRIVDNHVEIIVTDTGAGIQPDVLTKIFEPLFSTKGFGVGLGMSIVKQILEQHLGMILIKTKTGEGTTISLRFPIKTDKGAAA